MKVISIGTDRKLFDEGSAVRARIIGYAKEYSEYHVIVFSRQGLPEKQEIGPNVFLYATNSSSRFAYISDAIKIGKKIISDHNSIEGDVSITAQDPFECGLVGYILLKQVKGAQLELQVHTDVYNPYFTKGNLLNFWRVKVADRLFPKAHKIRVVSNRIKASIIERLGISEDKIYVKPIFVDITKIQTSPITFDIHKEFPQFDFITLILSRLEKEKDIPLAIRAWQKASVHRERAGLIIVGSGREENALKKLVQKLNLEEKVKFLPWQNNTASLFKTADLFLNTSKYEGYGMTLVEANAAGIPIVSTDVGIVKELSNAKICPVGDEMCLAAHIKSHL